MNRFKLLFLVLSLICCSQVLWAQLSVGAGLSYGFDVAKPGVFGRAAYQINDNVRGNLTLNFFFADKADVLGIKVKSSLWTINLDGHIGIVDSDKAQIYGLAGINFATASATVEVPGVGNESDSSSKIGFNVGAGAQLVTNGNLRPLAEIKYVLGDASQLVIMAGAVLNF